MKYFFDTSVLVEIASGDPQLELYLKEEYTFLSVNLAELYYVLLQKFDKKVAGFFHGFLASGAVELPISLIASALEFRYANKKRNLSYIDCFGYIYAKENGYLFLTKDTGFQGLDNVKFI